MSEQAQNLNENEELVEEVQQETTSTEDPLEEAIARVQELEEQLKAQVEETLSLIHISEPPRQAEISYAVFCL